MQLSSSREAATCAHTQELPSILGNTKVHYHFCKTLPQISILSQINQFIPPQSVSPISILTLSTHLLLCLPSGLFPLTFPAMTYSPHSRYIPAHRILLDLTILIILGEK
jgi:hypothetical protein